jgi:hypothetical protein
MPQVRQEVLESMLSSAASEQRACINLLDEILETTGSLWLGNELSFTAASLDAGSNLQPFLKAAPTRCAGFL